MENDEEKMWLSQIPKAMSSRLRPKSVSSILDRLISERGYAAEQSTQLIQDQWRIAVGDALFEQSRIGKIQRGVLQVHALNAIVMAELGYSKSKALKHLQSALPGFKIKDIRFLLNR
jgi:hypothetical protein